MWRWTQNGYVNVNVYMTYVHSVTCINAVNMSKCIRWGILTQCINVQCCEDTTAKWCNCDNRNVSVSKLNSASVFRKNWENLTGQLTLILAAYFSPLHPFSQALSISLLGEKQTGVLLCPRIPKDQVFLINSHFFKTILQATKYYSVRVK